MHYAPQQRSLKRTMPRLSNLALELHQYTASNARQPCWAANPPPPKPHTAHCCRVAISCSITTRPRPTWLAGWTSY